MPSFADENTILLTSPIIATLVIKGEATDFSATHSMELVESVLMFIDGAQEAGPRVDHESGVKGTIR